MKREEKEALVADMAERLKRAQATYLVDYQGLTVEIMNALRKDLRKNKAEFQVVKNRLLKLACKETGASAIKEHFVGPCALAISYDDVVAPAKVLVAYAKKSDRLKLKVGEIGGKMFDQEGVKRVAELPAREVLLAQALSAMQAVPGSLVRVLHGVVANLLYVLKAIETKKSEA
ncbi:MAG: 50S ribosomal protein L10 [Deltaproteobacteria bacterium]|nr:50S ribosomal protein L10 [Deltaproteobacteria bacterium]